MALNQRLTHVRRKPLPFGVCRKFTEPVPTRSSCRGEQLCPMAHRDSTVRSPGILERVGASLSKNPSIFSLLFTVCSSKLVGSTWLRELSSHATCPIAIGSLDYTHIPFPSTLDFHPIRRCHMSTWAPLGSPGLTNFAHDT